MIAVLFTGFVEPKNLSDYLAVAKRHAALSLQDKGCIRFDVLAPDGDEVKFIEIWESRDCLDAHAKRVSAGEEAPLMNALRYKKEMRIFDIL